MKPVTSLPAKCISFQGKQDEAITRDVAVEAPVAFEINGLAYAVMMASPSDLEDYAVGFALSEGLAQHPASITQLDMAEVDQGVIIRMMIPDLAEDLQERIRLRLNEGSCGLCGLRSIEEVLRPLPVLQMAEPVVPDAIHRAATALSGQQLLGQATGAMHAAAFCDVSGKILLTREDVGRHNALDKLVGAMARQGFDATQGFVLLTARCSYELVEKTVRAGCPTLVTVSAPTSLAVERAEAAGLTLYALARHDSVLRMHAPAGYGRIEEQSAIAGEN
ncbi:formate dehydrogenase accessory sulfurtransferase FdhD [Erythrobacteraceae bacterium E2-1 Yellow Sea]|nr:formate dehydrogenase accessory sulfurtransferase FdhD [Erythrobacteraceae bacterium E2-1 Yellow Sea]